MISVLGVISIIVYLLLFTLMGVLVFHPQAVANVIIRNYPSALNDAVVKASAAATSPAPFKVRKYRQSDVYTFNDETYERGSPLLVFISGGMFIMVRPELMAIQKFPSSRRIVTFTYPVRFKECTVDIVDYIRDLIVNYLPACYESDPPTKVYLMAHSAGAFYAIMLLQLMHDTNKKFPFDVVKFIGINGFYGSGTTKTLLFKVLSMCYVEKSLPYRVPASIVDKVNRVHIITTTDDFIRDSSETFALNNGLVAHVIKGDHTSLNKLTKPESAAMFEYINRLVLT